MSYTLTQRMGLSKPDAQTQQKFEISKYNEMLDLIDTLAGITPVGSLSAAPTTKLYDGRMIITRDTTNVYVYNFGLSKWEQANIQTPAQISTSQVAMVTEAQRKSLSRVNLLDGTVVFNTTSNKLEIYKKDNFTWYDAVANVTWVTVDPNAGVSANVNFTVLGTPTTVTTSTTSPFINGKRQIDRTQNGVLWAFVPVTYSDGSKALECRYSTDNGATWTLNGSAGNYSTTASSYTLSLSAFIDIDDYAHVAYKDASSGYVMYTRGTPNLARTSYSWSAPLQLWSSVSYDIPDIVAFRDPSTSGAYFVVICVSGVVSNNSFAYWKYVSISSSGSFGTSHAANTDGYAIRSANYTSSSLVHASVDFRHTGDSKTIQVQPDLFFCWSAPSTGSGSGIRFMKYAYAGSNGWSSGGEKELDPNHYMLNSEAVTIFYDGTRCVVAGTMYTGSQWDLVVTDRDLADTTSTVRVVSADVATNGANATFSGTNSYDNAGNVYMFGADRTGADGTRKLNVRRWTRSTSALEAVQTFNSAGRNSPYASCRRGYGGNRLDFMWIDGLSGPYNIKYNNLTAIPPGVQGNLGPVVNITTSPFNYSTSHANQRKIDRCQNGVLWQVMAKDTSQGPWYTSYSIDNGATWVGSNYIQNGSGSTTQNYNHTGSFFIDLDDYAHFVFKDNSDGRLYYRRGTPNTARTAYTWSTAFSIVSDANGDYADIVAFRDPGTPGAWVAWVALSYVTGANNYCSMYPLKITSAGAVSSTGSVDTGSFGVTNGYTYPSIDFRHTGDGKTIATQPDLFIAWSAGTTGTGKGIRFKKGTYSSGTWSWGAEREIDTARYWINGSIQSCMFDGTRVVIAGQATDPSIGDVLAIYERDVADTTTTPRILISGPTGAAAIYWGNCTYDGNGNVYFSGRDATGTTGSRKVNVRKWTRSTTTLEAFQTVDTAGSDAPWVSFRRGYKTNATDQLDFVYSSGTASPYTVKAGKIT